MCRTSPLTSRPRPRKESRPLIRLPGANGTGVSRSAPPSPKLRISRRRHVSSVPVNVPTISKRARPRRSPMCFFTKCLLRLSDLATRQPAPSEVQRSRQRRRGFSPPRNSVFCQTFCRNSVLTRFERRFAAIRLLYLEDKSLPFEASFRPYSIAPQRRAGFWLPSG